MILIIYNWIIAGHAPYVEEEDKFLVLYLSFLENVEQITEVNH
jgi:esterase